MLCDKCLNRTICKYYAFFADAPMVINIESCEKAIMSVKQPTLKDPNDNVALLNFKQPIDYSQFNIPQEENDEEYVSLDEEYVAEFYEESDFFDICKKSATPFGATPWCQYRGCRMPGEA